MLDIVVEIVFQILCGLTGHAVLCVLTLGRWPATKKYDAVAMVVGFLFWVLVGIGIWLIFFR